MSERVCRYGCPDPTHVCQECLEGASRLSGYYCERHAVRHDALVKDAGGSVFCKPIEPEPCGALWANSMMKEK